MDCSLPQPPSTPSGRARTDRSAHWRRRVLVCSLALAVCSSSAAYSQPAPDDTKPDAPPANSELNAQLFYQLLVGELQVTQGEPGAGFSLLLDAARKTRRPELFRRATDIALQARSGESALQAARAWAEAQPRSIEAQRYLVQILLALNRPAELTPPLRTLLRLTPANERNDLIQALPQLLARLGDKAAALKAAAPVLQEAGKTGANAAAAWTSLGRLQLAAGQPAQALDSAQHGHALDSKSLLPAWLTLVLVEQRQSGAEALLLHMLDDFDAATQRPVRLELSRLLIEQRRYADAQRQLLLLTRQPSRQAEPWLLQGLLQLQLGNIGEAAVSLEKYLSLPPARPEMGTRGHIQARLLLSQIAERQGRLADAQAWLDGIDDSEAREAIQLRRASLLARAGRVDEARALLHELPETGPVDARRKLLAEAQLLRDLGRYAEALQVYANATQRFPQDPDLAYEQAMTAEKAGLFEQMERILRDLIDRFPDYAHAYNALGYALAERNQDLPQARELILRALALAPDDPFIQDSLGWVEFRLGNLGEARRVLQAAYAKRPDAEIAAHLGEVLWTAGERDAARKLWQEGLQQQGNNETLKRTINRLQAQP
ncbi:MAG: hypothetical protein RJA36_1738 [Pseudomonadota bacterium]|jgi:tetratricopeptide (TPR) repeat protein